jgi:hypothetical protein
MNKLQTLLVSTVLAGTALSAVAQTAKPGLWEFSTTMNDASGEMAGAMAEAQRQMANMPADQRKMMEDMMAKQGINLRMNAGGGTSIKVCLTQEMVDRNELGAQQPGDCKHTSSPRVGNTLKFAFVCTTPPSSGEGEVTFISPEAFNTKMRTTVTRKGKPEKMSMESSGKFLSTDCGAIKPMAMPKKQAG